uniref:Uncharacterized protein n=1 Tax=Ditylum brightwellii TaxID=49249 RepID=A0A6U3V0M2_9STRA|mmetsp:Transcript_31014/g.41389  ORF Transcript_31014/g.41389 Transcript_31014/m.41389 type:complete len:152 (+) Transcript_31014:105-560(+)
MISDWKKFISFQSRPNYNTFPGLPDCITTVRLILGLIYGLSLAYRSMHGGVGVIFGLNVITFVPIFYINSFLSADVDSYKSLNFVGVANAMGLMLLVWIYFFTLTHEEEEAAFAASIKTVVEQIVTSSSEDGEFDGADAVAGEDVIPDKEF